ncbi:ribonuclease E/G, partial [Candidatus Liberibacter asiaticus]
RSVEEYLLQYTAHNIIVHTHSDVVLYLLNQKRATIVEYEARFGVSINVVIGIELADKLFYIEKGSPVQALVNTGHKVGSDSQAPSYDKNIECVWQDEALLPIPKSESLEDIQDNIVSEESTGVIRKRRRRRSRRRPATDHHDAGVVSDVSSIQNVIDDSFDMYMEPSDITNHNLLENGAHGFTENYDVSIPPVSTPEMESSNSSSDPIVKKTRWWKRRK